MSHKPLRISRRVTAAVALMESGIVDLSTIATAVGLTVDRVRRIEAANDRHVRRVATQRIPDDFVFRLRKNVVCPKCGSRIYLVPCLVCRIMQERQADGPRIRQAACG